MKEDLKIIAVIWGLVASVIGGLFGAYQACVDCILEYPALFSIGVALFFEVIFLTFIIIHAKPIVKQLKTGVDNNRDALAEMRNKSKEQYLALQKSHLISEIDRLFARYKDSAIISSDDARYVSDLETLRKKLNMNSYNERKLKHLIELDIV